ncbi:MAG: hypothetical protein IPO27_13190 [Bacteroidetes bacterium]|nr:hypothetical protein [Bacteroidota bacterium]
MTNITSDSVLIDAPAARVYEFLCNFNNYQMIMPDQVEDWQSNHNEGSFSIKNMASIGLVITERMPFNLIKLVKTKAPFYLDLDCKISEMSEGIQCQLQLVMQADLNMMMKILATQPLTNLVNTLAYNCKKVIENGTE